MKRIFLIFTPRQWTCIGLVMVIVFCLWVGWRDFDPMLSQDEVREMIRYSIRRSIQILVQHVIPVVAGIYLIKTIIDGLREAD